MEKITFGMEFFLFDMNFFTQGGGIAVYKPSPLEKAIRNSSINQNLKYSLQKGTAEWVVPFGLILGN